MLRAQAITDLIETAVVERNAAQARADAATTESAFALASQRVRYYDGYIRALNDVLVSV